MGCSGLWKSEYLKEIYVGVRSVSRNVFGFSLTPSQNKKMVYAFKLVNRCKLPPYPNGIDC